MLGPHAIAPPPWAEPNTSARKALLDHRPAAPAKHLRLGFKPPSAEQVSAEANGAAGSHLAAAAPVVSNQRYGATFWFTWKRLSGS